MPTLSAVRTSAAVRSCCLLSSQRRAAGPQWLALLAGVELYRGRGNRSWRWRCHGGGGLGASAPLLSTGLAAPSPGGLVGLSSKRHPQCHSQVTVSVTVNVHGGFFASVAQPQKGPQQAYPAPTILVIKLVCIKVIKLVCLVVQSVMLLFRIFKTLSIPNCKS